MCRTMQYVSAVCLLLIMIRHYKIVYCVNENVWLKRFQGYWLNRENSKSFQCEQKAACDIIRPVPMHMKAVTDKLQFNNSISYVYPYVTTPHSYILDMKNTFIKVMWACITT